MKPHVLYSRHILKTRMKAAYAVRLLPILARMANFLGRAYEKLSVQAPRDVITKVKDEENLLRLF